MVEDPFSEHNNRIITEIFGDDIPLKKLKSLKFCITTDLGGGISKYTLIRPHTDRYF